MSTTALTKLFDLLTNTLSTSDMMWLIKEMKEYVCDSEENMKPYSVEELRARVAISERQLANGEWMDFDEAMDEIERELDKEPEMAEVL